MPTAAAAKAAPGGAGTGGQARATDARQSQASHDPALTHAPYHGCLFP